VVTKWLFLGLAIGSGVTGSISLKAALDHPAWYLLVAACYVSAFSSLVMVLRHGMPLGVAYGIWGAVGVALTAAFAVVFFGERLTPAVLAGMALVIGGVLCVEVGAHRAAQQQEGSS
jgi:small multidrug resistance pump